jgi:hypothetical protein
VNEAIGASVRSSADFEAGLTRMVASTVVHGEGPPQDLREARAFVAHAPTGRVLSWPPRILNRSTKGYVLAALGDTIQARNDSELLFRLLDISETGNLPNNPFARNGQSVFLPESPRSQQLALEGLRGWLASEKAPGPPALRCLLQATAGLIESLTAEEGRSLVHRLVILVARSLDSDDQDDADYPYREIIPAAYEAIGRLDPAGGEGRDFLERELDRWITGRYFGAEARIA